MKMLNFSITDSLNENEKYIFNILVEYFKRDNIKSYVVGGAVRDNLLKIPPKDVDIAVEGDFELIIKKLPLVERVIYHERFKTSSVYFKNGAQFDIIRCRKESYIKNGSLPEVYPATIVEDLARRDFTINAVAYDIINNCLIDPYNGIEHIKRKIIKKIKDDSYKEDPTRIFRAVRYAVRYGFILEDEDEILRCVEKDVFSTISYDRIMKEIMLMAGENGWQQNIYECFRLNIIKSSKKSLFHNKVELKDHLNIRLCSIYRVLNDSTIKNVFKNNSILEKNLKKAFQEYEGIEMELLKCWDNNHIFNILDKCNSYDLVLLGYNTKLTYKLLNYINLKDKYREIKAKCLLELGIEKGRLIRDIIEEIRRVRLNTLLEIDENYIRNNIGEILNGIKHKNT
ncbi:CCA tRNA nucleotidyltransferase [Clostridium sp. KNHs214]|uniref:CCA tRNA nucleotidyltransferase n=1 Tax=Clostridium sp. KNHs214 TaxID=1540257 RepID=UPI00068998F9|nr:CCA tRNA nucleotidyltransferase [Clostridium sp. KNHs214]